MKKIFNFFTILLFSLFLFSNANCRKEKKDSFVKGRIIDVKTGVPIEGVKIQYGISDARTYGVKGVYDVITDSDGKFNIDYGDDEGLTNVIISKAGYVPKSHFGIPPTKTENGYEVVMYPRDGVLKLTIENGLGQHDSICHGVYSAIFDSEMRLSSGILVSFNDYKLSLLAGDFYSINIPVATEETIQIYWSFEEIHSYYPFKDAPFRDSVFVSQNDTVYYTITY